MTSADRRDSTPGAAWTARRWLMVTAQARSRSSAVKNSSATIPTAASRRCGRSISRSIKASSSPSWDRRAAASPRCSTSWAASTSRPAGLIYFDGVALLKSVATRRPAREQDRLHLPGVLPPADADGLRERPGADVRGATSPRWNAARRPIKPARARRHGRTASTTCRRCSAPANASASPSLDRWRTTRSSCLPTSQRVTSTRRTAKRSSNSSSNCTGDHGVTLVVVTHSEEVGHRAKRLIRLRDGSGHRGSGSRDSRIKPQINIR